jgi:hypothetical protein
MSIELVIDINCVSLKMFIGMIKKLIKEFPNKEIKIVSFYSNEQRMKKLGINILPAWIIDDEVILVNPTDYASIKKKVNQKLNQQQD